MKRIDVLKASLKRNMKQLEKAIAHASKYSVTLSGDSSMEAVEEYAQAVKETAEAIMKEEQKEEGDIDAPERVRQSNLKQLKETMNMKIKNAAEFFKVGDKIEIPVYPVAITKPSRQKWVPAFIERIENGVAYALSFDYSTGVGANRKHLPVSKLMFDGMEKGIDFRDVTQYDNSLEGIEFAKQIVQ